MKFTKAKWIGIPQSELERCNIPDGDMTGRSAYFTCVFTAKPKEEKNILITASSRYRLWCNGEAVASGPCKGSKEEQFYDELVLKNLHEGENLLAVQVMYQDVEGCFDPRSNRAGIFGVDAPRVGHRLVVEGDGVTTGEADYRCYLDGSFYLNKPHVLEFLGAIQENIDFGALPENWKRVPETGRTWPESRVLFDACPDPFLSRVGMRASVPYNERPIPLLKEEPAEFSRVLIMDAIAESKETAEEEDSGEYADLAFHRLISSDDFDQLPDRIEIPADTHPNTFYMTQLFIQMPI
ncbi:MAG: hypothetical protein Q4B22_03605 [Eubacteriales bacterium]|nr:hypothetical protein [Eubacteriales bacterium]